MDYSAMLLPKQSWTKKGKAKLKKTPKHKRRKSILQNDKDNRCFLCMLLNGDYSTKDTEEHHVIYGSGRRKISEEYGLRVRLCPEHHRTEEEGAHNNSENAVLMKQIAQRRFMEEYPDEDWMQVVGKNYLKEEEDGKVIL